MGFAVNHWGYKLPSDGMWKPFDPAGTQVGYSDSAATDKEEVISFAAKVNSIPPTGTYKLSVVLTAVANSKPVGIEDVVYMQDFAEASDADKSSILASMTEGTSYTIKDSRDEQDYTVAKLFDGNIWMTKNLDLAGGTTLTPDKSNVTSNYTLPASSLSGWGDSAAQQRMYTIATPPAVSMQAIPPLLAIVIIHSSLLPLALTHPLEMLHQISAQQAGGSLPQRKQTYWWGNSTHEKKLPALHLWG